MPRYVALLRGVNVGGKNVLPMTELRGLVESMGHREVTTYIQSGNVLFTATERVTAGDLESAILRRFDIHAGVVLRTSAEIRRAHDANPFEDVDPARLHIGFLSQKPAAEGLRASEREPVAPEAFAVRGREVYLHLPNGVGRAKLPVYLERKLGVPMTIRNWNTVTKLVELAG